MRLQVPVAQIKWFNKSKIKMKSKMINKLIDDFKKYSHEKTNGSKSAEHQRAF